MWKAEKGAAGDKVPSLHGASCMYWSPRGKLIRPLFVDGGYTQPGQGLHLPVHTRHRA